MLIEKDGKLMDVEIINKSSIHSSLKATYYKYNGCLSNSIKTKAGLKNILDIMVCHKIYKKYCEFSYDTDDLEYDFDIKYRNYQQFATNCGEYHHYNKFHFRMVFFLKKTNASS